MSSSDIFSLTKTDYPDMPGCFSFDIEKGKQPYSLFTGTYQQCSDFRDELEQEWELEDRCWNPEYYEE